MSLDVFKPLLELAHNYPILGALITFGIAFLESLAVFGLVVPGSVFMTAIGTLIGSGILPPVSTLLWASSGAFIGDVLSYWLGVRYHAHIRSYWPFSRFPGLLQKGEAFFLQHGGKSVFIARFLGPVRPILPLVAGMMGMPQARFMLIDAFSALLWAPVYMLPGMLLGAASHDLPPEAATRFVGVVLATIVILWLFSWLIRKIIQKALALSDFILSHTWTMMGKTMLLKKLHITLQNPNNPSDHTPLNRAILLILSLGCLIVLMDSVNSTGLLTRWNEPVYFLLRSLRTTFSDHLALLITTFGQKQVILSAFFVVFLALAYMKAWWTALHWLSVGIICSAAAWTIKYCVQEPRPNGILGPFDGSAFPSGHASLAMAYFGITALIIVTHKPTWRKITYNTAAIIIAAVMLSRLYLSAHWLTDVIGGVFCGASSILLVALSYQRRNDSAFKLKPFISLALGTVVLIAGIYFGLKHNNMKEMYTIIWPQTTFTEQQWWNQHIDEIPIYRTNRLGKPAQELNIQWLGDINEIKTALLAQGWQYEPKRNLTSTLSRIAAPAGTAQLPILPTLFQDHRADLILIYNYSANHKPIIIHLWPSHIDIAGKNVSLWIGTIYYEATKKGITILHPTQNASLLISTDSATHELIPFIKNFEYKLFTPDLSHTNSIINKQILAPIILIRDTPNQQKTEYKDSLKKMIQNNV